MTGVESTQATDHSGGVDDVLAKAAAALVAGLVLLIVAFVYLSRLPGWADRYGAVWVYLGFFVYMSIAGRFFWHGADAVMKRLRG